MTVKPYPAYRDSGAAWLGDVPESWKVLPAKAAFAERKRPNLPGDTHLTPSQKHGVLAQSEYMALTGNKVVLNLSGSDAMRHVEPRDFISHLRSFQGGLELSRLRGKVSAAYTVLAPRSGVVASYFKHLFKSTMYVQALQTTTDQLRDGQSIRYAQFALIPIPVPPSAEQRQIADYLDAQTAKIDALIGKQERLIETLAERRQAVISHAVTKGLDPNAPMMDSGVEWLGPVPYQAMPLKWALRFLTSGSRGWAEYYSDSGDTFVRIGNLTRGFLHLVMDDTQFVQIPYGAEGSRAVVQTGDVLFSITAYLGSVAVAERENAGSYVSQHVALARLVQTRLSPRFLGYFVLSEAGQRQLNEQAYGGTKVQLSLEDIKSLIVTVPPVAEQQEIARHLDRETSQIDALSAKAREMIDVLKERRQALISAAVTGKIDVRGLA